MEPISDEDLTKQQVEECVEKYLMFRDDSSDEEDEVVSYKGALDKLTKFQKAYNSKFLETIGHNNLSFITHAVAIKFLNSPKIQKSYNEKKKQIANSFDINFDFDELKTVIKESAQHMLGKKKSLLQNEVEMVISDKINKNLEGFFEALLKNIFPTFFKDLEEEPYCYIIDYLLSSLRKLRKVGFTFDLSDCQPEKFAIEFFSTLRLFNEWDRKRYDNRVTMDGFRPSVWIYSSEVSVEIQNEIKEMSYNRGYWRKELVSSLGAYSQINASCDQELNSPKEIGIEMIRYAQVE